MKFVGQPGLGQHGVFGQLVEHVPQGRVQRDVDHGQPRGRVQHVVRAQVEHHGEVLDAAEACQQLRMAGKGMSGPVQGLLLQRRRGDRVDLAAQGQLCRRDHRVVGRLPCPGVEPAGRDVQHVVDPQARQGMTPSVGSASSGESISCTCRSVCQSSTARRSTPGCPTTSGRHHSCTTVSVHAPTMISGPTPAGSPKVIAIKGFAFILVFYRREQGAGSGEQRGSGGPRGRGAGEKGMREKREKGRRKGKNPCARTENRQQ